MECPLCFEPFSEKERRPKLLGCGHTYCLLCLQQLGARQEQEQEQGRIACIACPECRERTPNPDASALKDNFLVLSASVEKSDASVTSSSRQGRGDSPTLWCVPCDAKARAACWDFGHSLQAANYRRRLEELRRLEEALRLELELHEAVLEEARSGSQQRGQRLREVQGCLEGLRGAAPSDTHLREAERLLQASQGRDQAVVLLRAEESFTVSSPTWKSDAVPLGEEVMLRLSLLSLQRKGLLRQQQQQAEGGELQSQPPQQPARKKRAVAEQEDQRRVVQQVHVQQDVPLEPVQQKSTEAVIPAALVEKNLWKLNSASPAEQVAEKTALLNREESVHVITGLLCDSDPAWVLRLLTSQSGSLQTLHLYLVSRDQLLALQGMPSLRCLTVWHAAQDLRNNPALPGHWQAKGLRRLDVRCLPKDTVRDLLRAHADSLEELVLRVGTAPDNNGKDKWPYSCSDLPALLQGRHRLQVLTLLRGSDFSHTAASCRQQKVALNRALPHCSGWIYCGAC